MTNTSTGNANWSNAGDSTDNFTVTSVSIDPQPARGATVTLSPSGTLATAITSCNARTTAKYGLITLLNQTDSLGAAGSGTYAPAIQFTVPFDAPMGGYKGSLVLTDQKGVQIACINFSFTV